VTTFDWIIIALLACVAVPAILLDGASAALARRMEEEDRP